MTFSEVIKIKDGVFYNLPFHQARMNETSRHFFGKPIALRLTPDMVPVGLRLGLVRCRVVYDREILSVEFMPYRLKEIRSVAIVHDDTIEYPYKSTDRTRLNDLLQSSGCDEIIIIKNGLITDASSANLICEDATGLYTPTSCLLPGTKRASLLQSGVIRERDFRLTDLENTKVRLINAMIDLEDEVYLPYFSLSL